MNIVKFIISKTGMPKKSLAKSLKKSRTTIWRWEHKDGQIKKKDLEAIADILDLSPNDLLRMVGR